MIWESSYWKDPLLTLEAQVAKWESNNSLEEADFANIERQLMTGFYSIRKLIESKKLSDSVCQENLDIQSFANLKPVTHFNWHHYESLYNLKSPLLKKLPLKIVCNQFIHSYVFIVSTNSSGFNGVYFCSDREKNKQLFYVSSSEVKRIFLVVSKDYSCQASYIFEKQKEDYTISQL